ALEQLRAAHGTLKAHALTRAHLAALHTSQGDTPYAANRFLAIASRCFTWGTQHGLLPDGHSNPARSIARYPEHHRERFLTRVELPRLADALRHVEPTGLAPFASAASRLLTLPGARLREILDARWSQVDFERGVIFLPDSKTGRKPIYLSPEVLE